LVPATSLTVGTGELAVVHGEPGEGVTAFGLALAHRFRSSTGSVTLHNAATRQGPRDVTAVVDAPGVTAPDEALPLRVVVGEELAFAGGPARRSDVARWLAAQQLTDRANDRFENLAPETRTRLLTTLAATRAGVRVLVLDRPDRHTSDVRGWSDLAMEYAGHGYAVVVLTATAAPTNLPFAPALLGALEQPAPLRCRPDTTDGGTATDDSTATHASTVTHDSAVPADATTPLDGAPTAEASGIAAALDTDSDDTRTAGDDSDTGEQAPEPDGHGETTEQGDNP